MSMGLATTGFFSINCAPTFANENCANAKLRSAFLGPLESMIAPTSAKLNVDKSGVKAATFGLTASGASALGESMTALIGAAGVSGITDTGAAGTAGTAGAAGAAGATFTAAACNTC